MTKLTHERLLEVLHYDEVSGNFYWKVSLAKRIKVGDKAGNLKSNRYVSISIDNEKFYAHRLAWFYIKKTWPNKILDHKNRVENANSFKNLRSASYSQNAGNIKPHKDNICGFKGVAKNKEKFSAKIFNGLKNIHLGSFETPELAAEAYDQAAIKQFGQFAKTNKQLGLIP